MVSVLWFISFSEDGAEVSMVSGPEQTGCVQQPMLLLQVSSAFSGIFLSSAALLSLAHLVLTGIPQSLVFDWLFLR